MWNIMIIFFKYFSSFCLSFCGALTVFILVRLMVSHIPLKLCSFFFHCLWFSDCIISILLSSNTLIFELSPSSEFVNCNYIFNSRIFICFVCFFYNLYLLMCFIWWDIVAVCSFVSWSIVSFYLILWTYFLFLKSC